MGRGKFVTMVKTGGASLGSRKRGLVAGEPSSAGQNTDPPPIAGGLSSGDNIRLPDAGAAMDPNNADTNTGGLSSGEQIRGPDAGVALNPNKADTNTGGASEGRTRPSIHRKAKEKPVQKLVVIQETPPPAPAPDKPGPADFEPWPLGLIGDHRSGHEWLGAFVNFTDEEPPDDDSTNEDATNDDSTIVQQGHIIDVSEGDEGKLFVTIEMLIRPDTYRRHENELLWTAVRVRRSVKCVRNEITVKTSIKEFGKIPVEDREDCFIIFSFLPPGGRRRKLNFEDKQIIWAQGQFWDKCIQMGPNHQAELPCVLPETLREHILSYHGMRHKSSNAAAYRDLSDEDIIEYLVASYKAQLEPGRIVTFISNRKKFGCVRGKHARRLIPDGSFYDIKINGEMVLVRENDLLVHFSAEIAMRVLLDNFGDTDAALLQFMLQPRLCFKREMVWPEHEFDAVCRYLLSANNNASGLLSDGSTAEEKQGTDTAAVPLKRAKELTKLLDQFLQSPATADAEERSLQTNSKEHRFSHYVKYETGSGDFISVFHRDYLRAHPTIKVTPPGRLLPQIENTSASNTSTHNDSGEPSNNNIHTQSLPHEGEDESNVEGRSSEVGKSSTIRNTSNNNEVVDSVLQVMQSRRLMPEAQNISASSGHLQLLAGTSFAQEFYEAGDKVPLNILDYGAHDSDVGGGRSTDGGSNSTGEKRMYLWQRSLPDKSRIVSAAALHTATGEGPSHGATASTMSQGALVPLEAPTRAKKTVRFELPELASHDVICVDKALQSGTRGRSLSIESVNHAGVSAPIEQVTAGALTHSQPLTFAEDLVGDVPYVGNGKGRLFADDGSVNYIGSPAAPVGPQDT